MLEKAKAGDRAALEEVLGSLLPAVVRFGRTMCKNDADAEDVVQDTLLSVAANLKSFEGRSSLSSWVFTLARTACSRRRRGLKNRPGVDLEALGELTADVDVERDQERAELGRALSTALRSLPEEAREVVWLRDVEGLTAAEAASTLGITVDALKSRLHRARGALRAALTPVLESPLPAPQSSCPDVATQFSAHLEGDLSAVDCQAMQEHLTTCPRCSATCDALKEALSLCGRVSARKVAPAVQARVREAIRALLDGRAASSL